MVTRKIDTSGLRCPLPVIKMEAALRKMAPDEILEITADDPIARIDIPHFALENGHKIKELPENASGRADAVTWQIICGPKENRQKHAEDAPKADDAP